MQEIRRYPTRRTQEVIEFDDGSRKRICYSQSCPHFYQDETGALRPINLAIREKENAKGDKQHVRDRHVVSVGFRDDGNHAKFLGFRPDVNQVLGTEQLEFSLDAIKFGGAKQSTDLSRNDKVDDLTTRLGSIVIRSTRQRTRQLIRIDRPITSFEIRYTLHLTGLTVEEKGGEYWFYGNGGKEFRFRIRKPCLCGTDFQPLDIRGELVEHGLTDNGDGTCTYAKQSTAAFAKAKLPTDYYIDADTYYSSTADGYVYAYGDVWADVRSAGTGSSASDSSTRYSSAFFVQALDYAGSHYGIRRSFFYFDTSGASNPDAVDLNIYGYNNSAADVSAQKGTQASTLTVADFGAFSGNEYGYKNPWVINAYNTLSFNATGISEIETSGTTKLCCRERVHDYLDSAPPDFGAISSGCRFADNTGTANDPYLEITEGSSGTTVTPSAVSASWSTVAPELKERVKPSAVSATWSAVAPGLKKAISPSAASLAWSTAVPATAKSTAPSPASCTWSVVSPVLPRTVCPPPISATWSAPTPATSKTARPDPASATWSAVTPSTRTASTPSPISATWSVVVPSLCKRITVSPATVAWSVSVPQASDRITPSPVSATWSAVTPTLGKRITPSPVSATWSASTPATSKTARPDPASATWSVVVPSLCKRITVSPISATWATAIPTTVTSGKVMPAGLLQSGHYHLGV